MDNQELEALWDYHNATKHSYQSVRSNVHYLDWSTYPLPFKFYPELEEIPLPRDWPETGCDALAAISSKESPAGAEIDLKMLASILYYAAGITKSRSFAGGEIYFRAAACTGALYEMELYVACGDLTDMEAGLYHFNPLDFALRKLRAGDYRSVLMNATANHPAVANASLVLICTGTYWRNAWKYQARTYRHFFWDNGTILANLLAMTAAFRLRAELIMGFVDDEVNNLLSLDTGREVATSLVALGTSGAKDSNIAMRSPVAVEPLPFVVTPQKGEVNYPLMRAAHAASSLVTMDKVNSWRGRTLAGRIAGTSGKTTELEPLPDSRLPGDTIEQVILRRGSTRRFARSPITFQQLSTILAFATQGIQADFLGAAGTRLNDLYLVVNAVEGLPSGSYFLRRDQPRLEMLQQGDFRGAAGHLGLDQELPADASVDIFFLADLKEIMQRFGNRGYRAAQIEAGIIGGKLYLAAYAQKVGASGLTFYDDEVTNFFSPHAAGKSALFLVAVGVPAKRRLQVL